MFKDYSTARKFEILESGDSEQLQAHASELGVPTFEEFKANKSKYLKAHDQVLASAAKGSTLLDKILDTRYVYEICGYRCKSLEEVERVAKEQGISIKDLDMRPELLPLNGNSGKAQMLIKFCSKYDREQRKEW